MLNRHSSIFKIVVLNMSDTYDYVFILLILLHILKPLWIYSNSYTYYLWICGILYIIQYYDKNEDHPLLTQLLTGKKGIPLVNIIISYKLKALLAFNQ